MCQGDKVQSGDVVCLLESMKMEFSVKAPCAGTVGDILVKKGQQVSAGERLLWL